MVAVTDQAPNRCAWCRGEFPEQVLRRHGGFCSAEHADAFRLQQRFGVAPPLSSASHEEDAATAGFEARQQESRTHCRWCGHPLPLLVRLKGGRFCSDWHERQYRRQQAELFLERVKKYRRMGGGSRLRSESAKIIIRPAPTGRSRAVADTSPPGAPDSSTSSTPPKWVEPPPPLVALPAFGNSRLKENPPRCAPALTVECGRALSPGGPSPAAWAENPAGKAPEMPAQGESSVQGRLHRTRISSGTSSTFTVSGSPANFRPQPPSWWSPVLWVAPRPPRVAAFCPPPQPHAGLTMAAQPSHFRLRLAVAAGYTAVVYGTPAANWSGVSSYADLRTPVAPKRRWTGRSLQSLFVHIIRPLHTLSFRCSERPDLRKPGWQQPGIGIAEGPREVSLAWAGTAPPPAALSSRSCLRPQIITSLRCQPRADREPAAGLWCNGRATAHPVQESITMAWAAPGAMHAAIGRPLRADRLAPARPVLGGPAAERCEPGGQEADRLAALAASVRWALTANPVSVRLVSPTGRMTVGWTMSWPTHTLIPFPLSRAGTSASASAAESRAAAGAWRTAEAPAGDEPGGALPRDRSLACWRTSGALCAIAVPRKEGLFRHSPPTRLDARLKEIPPTADFQAPSGGEVRTGRPAYDVRIRGRALQAGLLPLGRLELAAAPWRVAGESWRPEGRRTEICPVCGSPLWHGTVRRRGPQAPGFPHRAADCPAPVRPQRLRLPELSLRFSGLLLAARGRDSAVRGALSSPTDALKPGF